MDIRWGISKMRALGIVAVLMLCTPLRALAADDDQRVGQYFCYVENAAGVMHRKDQPAFAGKINLSDADKKFFVRISRIEHNQIVKELCAKTAGVFKEALANGSQMKTDSTDIYGTSNFDEMSSKIQSGNS